jgi:sterigmatocystin 8-O-methyltransferase
MTETFAASQFRINENAQEAAFCKAFQSKFFLPVAFHSFRFSTRIGLSSKREPKHVPDAETAAANKTFYEYVREDDPVRGARFDTSMEATALDPTVEMSYPFNSLRDGAVLVDVGGGKGHHCRRLMGQFPKMQFIVQDHQEAVKDLGPVDLGGDENRIKWQGHNFFDPQPVKGADVYLLNSVLMDHHDE